jgi:tetratricopeptide (TPR) repeat protein
MCRRYYTAIRTLHRAYREDTGEIGDDIGAFVESVLDPLPSHRWATVGAGERTMQHDRVITYLLHRADVASAATDARRSVDYAVTAAAIADKMYARREIGPERLLEVMRDHSTHLRGARMYGAALFVLNAAELIAVSAEDPGYQRTLLKLCRVMLCADSNVCQLDEADVLAVECEREFSGRDPRRATLSTFMRAGVAMRLGNMENALALFVIAQEAFASAGNAVDAAFAEQGIANCLVETGRAREARTAIDSAREIFSREAMLAEVIRVDWIAAKALAINGEYDRALADLNEVARAFLDARMLDEWVRVRLKAVEITLARDPGADVREMCESIAATSISLDEGETSRSRRCTAEALEYLRQSARRASITAPLASYVCKYVDAATAGRFAMFTPPASLVM